MAKKKKKKAGAQRDKAAPAKGRAAAAQDSVAALRAALPPDVKVIPIPANATVVVEVDVNDMAIPYTIALDTRTIIESLVDRREELPSMSVGTHRLSWGFAHAVKGWKHKLTLIVNGTATVLEERSEAKKDPDRSIGVAFLVVG